MRRTRSIAAGDCPAIFSGRRALLVMALAVGVIARPAPAQLKIELGGFGGFADADAGGGAAVPVEGASLKTDSETDELLARADQFAKQGRYDLASTLWQKVIDSSNDLVFTRDEWVEKTLEHSYQRYLSVSGDIESTLAKLPEAGLRGYRISGDGEAKLALAKIGPGQREGALAEVVRRFFLSSLGDDAAFELACLKLDRYEFLPAIRLLDKIINDYPNPSVAKDEVLLRLAALNARVGEPARALEIIADLRSRVTPAVPDAVLALVEKDIGKSNHAVQAVEPGAAIWPMVMGGPGRTGLMPAPGEAPGTEAGVAWAQPYDLHQPDGWSPLPKKDAPTPALNVDDPFALAAIRARSPGRPKAKKPATVKSMLGAWPKHSWRPAARALLHSGRIYFKNQDRLVCADTATGELRWLGFRTRYPVPASVGFRSPYGSQNKKAEVVGRVPKGALEIQNFADSVNQSMCIVRDKVLTLQGKPIDFTEEGASAAPDPAMMGRRGRGMNAGPGRFRENRLVAYHARNGKLQWMRTAGEADAEATKSACFAGPPVPYAGLVLVPVLEGAGMYLVAIDVEGGATQWRTFLCDEPASGSAVNAAIMVAVDGGEAYVSTGAGLVFSVDAISGTLNWAVRYPRTPANSAEHQRQMQRFGRFMARGMSFGFYFGGWSQEMIIPSGNAVIVTPTDFDHVVAFDRRTGSLLWESARRPGEGGRVGDYALGAHLGKFYVAGKDVVRCYRIKGGRMLWEATFDPGYGRGALTAEGIYIPADMDKVLQLDLDSGEQIAEYRVRTDGDQPLGNLYTDGQRMFALGLHRVYAIGETKPSARTDKKTDAKTGGEPAAGPDPEGGITN